MLLFFSKFLKSVSFVWTLTTKHGIQFGTFILQRIFTISSFDELSSVSNVLAVWVGEGCSLDPVKRNKSTSLY